MDRFGQTKIYLPHPVDTDDYRPIETEVYEKRILCWTKLDMSKGIDIIFKVAERLFEYQFDIPYVGSNKEYYKTIKPENVHLIPPQTSKEIPKLISKYPLVLGQFLLGLMGLSELEAMSCGKPLIAYWDRQYDSFYEEPCPIISSGNVRDIVNSIELNLGNKNLGMLSREWTIRNHSTPEVIDKLIKIYNEVLK
jgi:glycosyltransferase involved in cell wall biosynthesis